MVSHWSLSDKSLQISIIIIIIITCQIVDFAVPGDQKVKLKKVKREISTYTLLEN